MSFIGNWVDEATDWIGDVFGGDEADAARETAAAGVESTKIAAGVASENIALQRENIALQREGLDIAREGVDVARQETEFQRSQYQDWKDVYGDLQTNLGEYYNTLGPEKIISQGLQAEQAEYQKARASITKTLAQRGISGSGVEAAALTTLEGTHYTNRAGVRATAEQKVAEQKQAFLGIGLGQGAQLLGTLAATAGQEQGAYGNIRAAYGGATNAYGVAGQAYGQQVGAYTQQSGQQFGLAGNYTTASYKLKQQGADLLSSVIGAGTAWAGG